MWVRGLKRSKVWQFARGTVAPYVGAWIETANKNYTHNMSFVAPYVGAWIETRNRSNGTYKVSCRTLCGCVD